MRTVHACTLVLALGASCAFTACSDYRDDGPSAGTHEDARVDHANNTIADFKRKDPSMEKFFSESYGYAVMPKVTKGAAGIGAAHGADGVVYEHGRVVGTATMTQITVGAQLGGQDFSEIIFFQDKLSLDNFKRDQTEFAANASAVAATSGAARTSDYSNGVAIFTMPLGGLMFEAAIGGQKFDYENLR